MALSRFSPAFIFLICCAGTAVAQTIENVRASFDGKNVIITYDLGFSDPNQKFKVTLFSSHDNFGRPLSLVSGDIGQAVIVGKSNRVVWDVKNTLPGDFDGEIIFKMTASVVAAPKLILKSLQKSSFKRGQSIVLHWEGAYPSDKLNIELFKNDVLKDRIATGEQNKQSFTWQMPKKQKTGSDYQIKIYSEARPGEPAVSQNFRVKPKVPLLVKVLPFLVAGGVIAAISGGGGEGPVVVVEDDLPGPIKPN